MPLGTCERDVLWRQENEELRAKQAAAEERSRKAEARQQADAHKQVFRRQLSDRSIHPTFCCWQHRSIKSCGYLAWHTCLQPMHLHLGDHWLHRSSQAHCWAHVIRCHEEMPFCRQATRHSSSSGMMQLWRLTAGLWTPALGTQLLRPWSSVTGQLLTWVPGAVSMRLQIVSRQAPLGPYLNQPWHVV